MKRAGKTSFPDLVVVLAVFMVTGGALIAARAKFVAHQQVLICSRNLSQLGKAILLYTNDERNGAYPRTTYDRATTDKPVFGTPYVAVSKLGPLPSADSDPFFGKTSAAEANDVTAALFLLLRTQDITSGEFVCPATKQTRWDFGGGANTASNWSNWDGPKSLLEHLSYSYQNPYPSGEAISRGFQLNNSITSEFVVMSDMNPGVDELLTATPVAPPREPEVKWVGTSLMILGKRIDSDEAWAAALPAKEIQAINSPNHGGMGQNVLYGDGHVEFVRSPFVGVAGDNIYTRGKHFEPKDAASKDWKEAIVGSPYDGNDSVLLPTAKQLAK